MVEDNKQGKIMESGDLREGVNKNSDKKFLGVRKENFEEIRSVFKTPRLLVGANAIRTLQPIKGFDLGLLQQEEENEKAEGKTPKRKNSIEILKTHRLFSDLDDNDQKD